MVISTASSTVEVSDGTMGAVEAFTGTQLPRANVPLLLSDAGTMDRLAELVRNLLAPQLIQTIAVVSGAVGGNTGAQFVAQTAPFVAADPNTLLQMATLQNDIAEAMRGYAVEMDYTRRQALIMFIFMMLELAIAAAEAFFFPEDAIERVATTRTIIQMILRSSVTKMIARSTAIQMLFMPGSSLLAQLSQMAEGIRSGIDWAEVGKQALYGLAVAGLTVVAGPAMGKASAAFKDGLEKIDIKEAWSKFITKFTMDPAFEVTMEVGGGAGAALIVDHKYNPSNASGDGESGALEGAGEKSAEQFGLHGRKGSIHLGMTPSLPHLKMPSGPAFSVTGKPVVPINPVVTRPTTSDSADTLVDVPPPSPTLTGKTLVPEGGAPPVLPPMTIALAPVPAWVAASPQADQMTAAWSQFQQELAAQYGAILAEAAQIRDVIASLPQSVAQMYATWLASPSVASFLSDLDMPQQTLSPPILDDIYRSAVDQVVTEAARATVLSGQIVTPEQIAAALPVAFDQQALRSIGQIAGQEQLGLYVSAQPSMPPAVTEAVAQQIRQQIDHGVNSVLGTALPSMPGVLPVRPSAAAVDGVANVVDQATADLPAHVATVTAAGPAALSSIPVQTQIPATQIPGTPGETPVAPAGIPGETAIPQTQTPLVPNETAIQQTQAPVVPNETAAPVPESPGASSNTVAPAAPPATTSVQAPSVPGAASAATIETASSAAAFEQHVTSVAGTAQTQFTALTEQHAADPGVHAQLSEAYQKDWLGGYRAAFAPTTPATVEIDAERWSRIGAGEAFHIGDHRMTRTPGGERVAVRYALTPKPDEWVFQVRLHLTGAPGVDLDAVKQATLEGVAEHLNEPRLQLPTLNTAMRVDVRFVDDPAEAHATVTVDGTRSGSNQVTWRPGETPATYAHEVLHFLGVTDLADSGDEPALMGQHHDHEGALPIGESDLRQIVDTLAPHYAGVVGSHGPAIRPAGAASAAQGPTSVAAAWATGTDRPPNMNNAAASSAATGPDPSFTVPGNGFCLLYAFIATNPAAVVATLNATLPNDLRQFLSDPTRVRADMTSGHVHAGSPVGRVASLLQSHVSEYLRANRAGLASDVTERRLSFRNGRAREVAALSHGQVLRRLAQLGATDITDAGFLPVAELQRRYDQVRATMRAAGQQLPPATDVPHRQLTFVTAAGQGFDVNLLSPADARQFLVHVLIESPRPLDDGEYAQVKATVDNWGARWNRPSGEFLAPLLARATGSRINILRTDSHGTPVTVAAYGPAAATSVDLYHVAANPAVSGIFNHYNGSAPSAPVGPVPTPTPLAPPVIPLVPPVVQPAVTGVQPAVLGVQPVLQPITPPVPLGPPGDALLQTMATALPANMRIQRAVGGTLLHDNRTAPGPISTRIPAPIGTGPAVLLHPSALDPTDIAATLAGLRSQDTTMAVLHWPAEQPMTVARAHEVTTQALSAPASSAMLSVPRAALRDRPRSDDPRVIPLDANGQVTFFSGRPERYLFLPDVPGAPVRPTPYGRTQLSQGVYQLSDGWVIWDGGSHLWIGPQSDLAHAQSLLPDTGQWLPEPPVMLGWGATALPPGVRDLLRPVFAGMPAGSTRNLITSGIGLDRRSFPTEVHNLPAGVELAYVPGGVLAYTGARPAGTTAPLAWSDLADADRPRLVLHDSVNNPIGVVDAVRGALPAADTDRLQVFLAPSATASPAGSPAATVATQLHRRYGGTAVELVLPVSALGRTPAGFYLTPIDARGQETFPESATAFRVQTETLPEPPPSPLGLPRTASGAYRVNAGWTVASHNGVVLFAEHGTDPGTLPAGALTVPPSGVAVVIQSRGGEIPRDVATTAARLLSGVPQADQHVRVFGNPGSAEAATTDPIADATGALATGALAGSTPPFTPPPVPDARALALGNPKTTLPGLREIERALRAEARRRNSTVPKSEWELLHQRLLNNYSLVVGDDGYLFTLGDMEVLAKLAPDDPQLAANPAGSYDTAALGPSLDEIEGRGSTEDGGFHANQFTSGLFQTGAHGQSHGTTMRANRFRAALDFDVPLGPTWHFGPKVTGTINRVDQSSSHLIDAEKGRVLDTRADSTFYSYRPNWSVRTRDEASAWRTVALAAPAPDADRLVLAIPDHLLSGAGEQIVADLPAELRPNLDRLPQTLSASNITGLHRLYDNIIDQLRDGGFDLKIGDPMRQELQGKLWNLETHLDEAVNNRPGTAPGGTDPADTRGYHFTLHDNGSTAATIRVHARRNGGSARIGSTSNAAHIEKVRTAIVGHGGNFSLQNSSAISVGTSVDLPLGRDYDKPETFTDDPSLSVGGHVGMNWSNNDGGGATGASLAVKVSRYTGETGGHQVQLALSADVATVRAPMDNPRTTPEVDGSAAIRMSEPDAFAHGFSIDAQALRPDPGTAAPVAAPTNGAPRRVPYQDAADRLRNRGRHPEDVGGNVLPEHLLKGFVLGQSLPDVESAAVDRFKADLAQKLIDEGFLPDDVDRPWSHLSDSQGLSGKAPAPATRTAGAAEAGRTGIDYVRLGVNEATGHDIDAVVDNQDLFDKLVSTDGIESHFETLLQDGMTFTLRSWRSDVPKTARITLKARSRNTAALDANGNSVHFDRLTDELHIVNLIMALGIAGQGAGGTQGISADFGLKVNMPPSVPVLGSIDFLGAAFSRSVGASDRLTRILNRPELLEYPGRATLFNLLYDLDYSIDFSDKSEPVTSDKPIRAKVHAAVLDLNTDPRTFSDVATTDTESSVFDQAVIYHLDTRGMRAAVKSQLPGLTGGEAPMTDPVDSLTNQIAVQAHFKEALLGEYGTDMLIEPGFAANTSAAVSIKVDRVGGARFVGATPDKYVAGLIELYLAETSNTATRSSSLAINLPDLNLGKKWDRFKLSYSESAQVKMSDSETEETKRVGGLEMLKLAFNRAYAFTAPVDYSIRTGTQKEFGFVWSKTAVPTGVNLTNRDMMFLLPEPEALAQYANGKLPISDVQLRDAMSRWARGELVISGNTVAGLLSRWHGEIAARPGTDGVADVATYLTQHRIQGWAQTLADRHIDPAQRGAVLDPARRTQMETEFGLTLDPNINPFSSLTVPSYASRTGAKTFGHSAHDKITLLSATAPTDGTARPPITLLQAVRDKIDAEVPGLLAPGHDNWAAVGSGSGLLMVTPDRKVVGTLPGGLETLQHTLAGQRSNALINEMLHRHQGLKFYFMEKRGGVLADVVEVKLTARLHGNATYIDWIPEYGIENYGHAYNAYARTISRSLGWNVTPAKFGFSVDGTPIGGDASLSYAPQGSRSHKQGIQGTREQTVYDWSGHYLARDDATIDIEVSRLKMGNRPLNNASISLVDYLTEKFGGTVPTRSSTVSHEAQIDFKIPRGLAEATPVTAPTPLDLRPLQGLPGDAYVSGAMLDELHPAARKLMAELIGSNANDPAYRGSIALDGLLSRLNVDNHLPDALTPGGYLLASHLFVGGASNRRAAMRLKGSVHSLQVVSKIVNATGTGRYAKFHVTNASGQSRGQWRANLDGELSFLKKHGETHKGAQGDTTWDTKFTTGANRNAPLSQSTTFEDSKRSESHLKMQGPVYLVRMRGRFRLEGFSHRHSPALPANVEAFGPERFTAPDVKSSGWVTGDVDVEMFADEVKDMQRQMAQRHDWTTSAPANWPEPAPTATTHGLANLLVRTTPATMAEAPVAGRTIDAGTFDPGQAAAHAALLIRQRLGNNFDTVDPIRLTASTAGHARQRYETMLNWAITHLQTLNAVQKAAGHLPELIAARDGAPAQSTPLTPEQILGWVTGVHPAGEAPSGPVEQLEMLDQDPLAVARGIAFELHTHLDLQLTDQHGTATNYRINPQGQVVALRPTGPRGALSPVTAAEVVGGLNAGLIARANAAGIDRAARERIYRELLQETALQPEAAADLPRELEQRLIAARENGDDRARQLIGDSLPHRTGTPADPDAVPHHGTTPDARAARARRLMSRGVTVGWNTVGPLSTVPTTLRPGTRLWIARPQGAIAARVGVDGTYQVLDPLTTGAIDPKKTSEALWTGAPKLNDAAFRAQIAGAQTVTMIEPDALASWLEHRTNPAASRQYAQDNLAALRADPNAAALSTALHQARAASSTSTDPAAAAYEQALAFHHTLLGAIRAGLLDPAYRYLSADPAGAHTIVTTVLDRLIPALGANGQVVEPSSTVPTALRALAAVVTADPRATTDANLRQVTSETGMLRAVAAVLDPGISPLARFRAIAEGAWGYASTAPWDTILDRIVDRLPASAAPDIRTLRTGLDVINRQAYRAIDNLLTSLPPADLERLNTAVESSGATASDLARLWQNASDLDGLVAALPPAQVTGWAGTVTSTATLPQHQPPPGDGFLGQWMGITNWDQSRDFLDGHRLSLLSDRSHAQVQIQRATRSNDTNLAAQEALLTMARYGRVDDAYAYLNNPGHPPAVTRQQILLDLLAQPDLADPAAVSALAALAASLTGPAHVVDNADADLLHVAADLLAGLPIASERTTEVIRTVRETQSVAARARWADAIRTLADSTTPSLRPAMRDLAARLHTPTPASVGSTLGPTPRQDARQELIHLGDALGRVRGDLGRAGQQRTQAQAALDEVNARYDAVDQELDGVLQRRDNATAAIAHYNGELPDLHSRVSQAELAAEGAQRDVLALEQALPADQTGDPAELVAARKTLETLQKQLSGAEAEVVRATDIIGRATAARIQLNGRIPDLRRQLGELGEESDARRIGFLTYDNAVTRLQEAEAAHLAAGNAVQTRLNGITLEDAPDTLGLPPIDVDTELTDIARSGYAPVAVAELARRITARNGGNVPAEVLLTAVSGRPADAASLSSDEATVHDLERVQLARDLAAILGVPVELRFAGTSAAQRAPYLAYPAGEVVRLTVTGRVENVEQALGRLSAQVRTDLQAHDLTAELQFRLEQLHEAEIESLIDFEAGVAALVAEMNAP